jgi:hypothetical protein
MLDVSQGMSGGLAPASAGMSAMGNLTGLLNGAMPWGAALGAVGQALATPPAGPSDARHSGAVSNNQDTSGWSVNYGDGNIDAVRSQSAPGASASGGSLSDMVPGLGGAIGGVNMNLVLLAVGAIVLVKVLKRKQA